MASTQSTKVCATHRSAGRCRPCAREICDTQKRIVVECAIRDAKTTHGTKIAGSGDVADVDRGGRAGAARGVSVELREPQSAPGAGDDSLPVRVGEHRDFAGDGTRIQLAIPGRYGTDGLDDADLSADSGGNLPNFRDVHVRGVRGGVRGEHSGDGACVYSDFLRR